MQTLDCIAGHEWQRPSGRGRPPIACPEHRTPAQEQAVIRHTTFYVAHPRPKVDKPARPALTADERAEVARRAASARWANVSPEQRSEAARHAAFARHGITEATPRPAVVESECGFCGTAVRGARRRQCGAPECARRYRAERARRYMHERRARMRGNDWEPFDPVEIYDRDGWICGICAEPVDRDVYFPALMSVSLDHIIPVSLGGPHTRDNTRCAHFGCNSKRGNRPA